VIISKQIKLVFNKLYNTILKNAFSYVFFSHYFINTHFDNRMYKIDSYLFLTILNILIPICKASHGL
jgi:hypothetical protein